MDTNSSGNTNNSPETSPSTTIEIDNRFVIDNDEVNQLREHHHYMRRWITLILFVFYAIANSMQLLQEIVLKDGLEKYYGVSANWIELMTTVHIILFIIFALSDNYFLNQMSIRTTVLFGATWTCIGAWIKVFSVSPDLIHVVIIGHCLIAFSQVFVLTLPRRIAQFWFGQDRKPMAYYVCICGNQIGIIICIVVTPMLIEHWDYTPAIARDLQWLHYYVAAISSSMLILMIFFPDKPSTQPSLDQTADQQYVEEMARHRSNNQTIYLQSF